MPEKTGLEVLTELVDQVRILSKRLDLIDQNVKILINKTREGGEIKKPQIQEISPPPKEPEKKMTLNINNSPVKKKEGVMVSGKIVVVMNKNIVSVPEAIVKVYDDKDHIVKETKTNRGGMWMALLSPGKYVAEITGTFKGKELITQNKNFIVPAGLKEYEVI